jgi:hypothetical protein
MRPPRSSAKQARAQASPLHRRISAQFLDVAAAKVDMADKP